MSKMRLDRFISNQTQASRSKAAALIKSGKVSIDGVIVKQPSFSFSPENSKVMSDGIEIEYKKYVYLMLYKPKGVLSASNDKQRRTVMDLIPEDLRRPGMAPVGRLDKDTTGLLLITDDGDFAHNCISPKKMIPKKYKVTLDGEVTPDGEELLRFGVTLADGTKCLPAEIEKLTENTVYITIYEGKYHQIKRMFGVLGLGVNELHRESVGLLKLPKNMSAGEVIELNFDELLKKVINYKQNII